MKLLRLPRREVHRCSGDTSYDRARSIRDDQIPALDEVGWNAGGRDSVDPTIML